MFSGIVSHYGIVKQLAWDTHRDLDLTLEVFPDLVPNLVIGESVAINGACMTITKIKDHDLSFHVMHESLTKTNLKDLVIGEQVNIEFAITPTTRLNGHLVTGHVDGTIQLVHQTKDGQACLLTYAVPPPLMTYLVPKGSVCIDGVSLTIVNIDDVSNKFQVSVIPHTQRVTNLVTKKSTCYNLECDYYIKTLFKLQKHLK